MKRIFSICMGIILLLLSASGCKSEPETVPHIVKSETVEDIPSSDQSAEDTEDSEPTEVQESQESEEEREGFLADVHEYLELLDGTFADLYGKDPEQKMYFNYNYGAYAKKALLDYSIITDEYQDINEWFFIEGEMVKPEPGAADSYYNFETGKYKMTDFPVKTIYISGDSLVELYGESVTKEDMEQILGAEISTTENEMTGMLQSLPVEMEQYIVEIGFSMDDTVSSIGISKQP